MAGHADALRALAENVTLSPNATFRIDETAIERRENVACTDADVIAA
jgi:hypothetical protein